MRAERRKHQRAQLPGMRVVYEDAAGRRAEGAALDVGGGGVFVRCDQPLAAGKGLSLELVLQDESASLSALGRVIWVRAQPAAEGPAGMGIRFVDAEPAVLSRIEQLIANAQTPAPAAPIIAVAPTRERTVLGVGSPDPAPERSLPIALVNPKPKVEPPPSPPPPPPPSEASLVAAGLPRRRSRGWQAVLVVLLAAGCAGYLYRAQIPWVRSMIERGSGLIAPSQPVDAPAPAPSPQPPASTPAPIEAPSASPSASSAPVASASSSTIAAAKSAPAASTHAPAASAKPARRSLPRAPSPHGPANRGGDNPY